MKKLVLTTAVLALLALVVVLLFLLLPYAANRHIIPRFTGGLPFPEKNLHIASLTPYRASGSLHLGDEEGEGIGVPRFEMNYSPREIISGHLASLVVSSPRIMLDHGKNGFTVSGLQPPAATGEKEKKASIPALPMKVDRVVIEDGILLYRSDGHQENLLFDLELHLDYDEEKSGKYTLTEVRGHLSSSGAAEVEADFTVAQQPEKLAVTLSGEAKRLETAALRRVFASLGIELEGNMHFQLDIETEKLQRLKEFKGTVRFDDFTLVRDTVVLKGSGDTSLSVEVEGDARHIDYRLKGLHLEAPETAQMSGSGSYFFKPQRLEGAISLAAARTGSDIDLRYHGTVGAKTDISYNIEGEDFTLDQWLEVAAFTAKGRFTYDENALAATLSASFPRVRDARRDLTVRGVSVDLPFDLPERAPGVVIPGNLFIEGIAFGESDVASLVGSVSLSDRALQYSAEIHSPLNEQMKITCSGESVFAGDLSLNCYLPDVEIAASQFREVAALPEQLDFQAEISAETRLRLENGAPAGTATLRCREARVEYDKYSASGIAAQLFFPDLPELRSAGGQEVRVEAIDLGKIQMSDASIWLRLDDAESLFIERARLAWCGGRVETAGLMITKGMEELDATLYCDRLGYTELLGQLGVGNAEGEGSLNGRLPVRISRNDIEFDDGFLFSTPGQSGTVRFNDTDQFRQGMGEAGNSVYLEYTLNALENFSYNWTKLMFNTEKDDLLLTLQLDGKPAEPLPYGYREGRIVKKDKGPGLQHPIRLDVNFRLPLQELFRYGKNIQSIMENM